MERMEGGGDATVVSTAEYQRAPVLFLLKLSPGSEAKRVFTIFWLNSANITRTRLELHLHN